MKKTPCRSRVTFVANQLQKELPGLSGFSGANLKKMRIFFEKWAVFLNRSPPANDLDDKERNGVQTPIVKSDQVDYAELLLANRLPLANDLEFEEFFSIGFTLHYEIIAKTNNLEERLFYIHQAYINHWDKYKLREMLKSDLFHHQGKLPNNFTNTMRNTKNALQAIGMFKDEYLLDFINVEELGVRDEADIDERVVEKAIINNVKNFIMTFGRDFTFVGNQYHLEKFGHDEYPDLLFYNRELAALVAVELKQGAFKPAYLGQLSAYLRILDTEVKKSFENPSIGIILCKEADKTFVEFLIQGYDNPMGVATYKSAEDVRRVLPSEEALRRAMEEEM